MKSRDTHATAARSGTAREQRTSAALVGAHVVGLDALADGRAVGAQCLQIFLGDPQSWKTPPPRPDAERLQAASVPIYVHAPYLINVASPNNRIRIPSRKILAQTLAGAAVLGAAGVVVHAGHAEDGLERGFVRWWKVFEEIELPVPLLIENTPGGAHAVGKTVETLASLWDRIGSYGPGVCFDTCHAHVAGVDPIEMATRLREVTGKIDLVHANGSRDAAGSGRDRHANFGESLLDPDTIVAAARASGAPAIVCETPWADMAADLAFLRERLSAG